MAGNKTANRVAKDRYRRFAEEYVVDFNAGAAYLRAGYKSSTKSAASRSASALLKKPEVKALVDNLLQKKTNRTEITQDRVLEEGFNLLTSDIRNYLTWHDGGIKIKPSDELTEEEAKAIASIEIIESVTAEGDIVRRVKLKLFNKASILPTVGRFLGMDKQVIDHRVEYGAIKIPAMASREEWASVVSKEVGANGNGTSSNSQ